MNQWFLVSLAQSFPGTCVVIVSSSAAQYVALQVTNLNHVTAFEVTLYTLNANRQQAGQVIAVHQRVPGAIIDNYDALGMIIHHCQPAFRRSHRATGWETCANGLAFHDVA